ncbi:MAG: MATE family efflux transporter [Erysipelotrichaceae bacterium]|nr:MATE family efflux transporter [Erysipelotrichaceae bacterium]
MQESSLTKGPVLSTLLRFSAPYLIVCFLQQLYGMADLLIAGQFYQADIVTAVSVGSQFMHMVTAVIIGLTMGSTVMISRSVGEQDHEKTSLALGNTVTLFLILSGILTVLLFCLKDSILDWMSVPLEAYEACGQYLLLCFLGIPIITAYNIITCMYRGIGDSVTPAWFVAAACIINIVLDFVFMGVFDLHAQGAALATVLAQFGSVIFALVWLKRKPLGFEISRATLKLNKKMCRSLIGIGLPIACQDGFIQIAFLVITAIGNQRGLTDAAAIGIVEKLVSFFFLVPSAISQSLSAMAGQNVGAGRLDRAYLALKDSIGLCLGYSVLFIAVSLFAGKWMISLFIHDSAVIEAGYVYLSAYCFDMLGVSFHFNMSSYFCAFKKSMVSFIQNFLSVILFRVPGAWAASVLFPSTLLYMGMAAPAGSVFQALFCVIYFLCNKKNFLPEGKTA